MSKIKLNPKTKEIEIEVPDSFIREYLKGLGVSFKKSSKVVLSRSGKKTITVKKKKSIPGENYNTIVEVLKLSKGVPLTMKEIMETTKLNKHQIGYELRKGKKNGVIRQPEKGIYVFVKDNSSV